MILPRMHTGGKADEQEPNGSRSGKCVGRKIGAVVVGRVLVKSGCDMCVGGMSDNGSGRLEVFWQDQKFNGSGKLLV